MASEDNSMLTECEKVLSTFKSKNLGDVQNSVWKSNAINGNFALNQKRYIMKIIKDWYEFSMMKAKT